MHARMVKPTPWTDPGSGDHHFHAIRLTYWPCVGSRLTLHTATNTHPASQAIFS